MCSVITTFFDSSSSTRRRVRSRGTSSSGERSQFDGTERRADSKISQFCSFRLPDYRKSFIAMNNERFLSHLSRVYVAQIMEQFHVLVRLTTVLGNQYGYNFKSPGSNFCEPDLVSGQKRYIRREQYVFRFC